MNTECPLSPSAVPLEQALCNNALFGLLQDCPALAALTQAARPRTVARHEMITHRGDRPDGLFFVLSGEIKLLLISAAGAERIVRLVRGGDTFFEEAAIADTPLRMAAQAGRDSRILFVPRHAVQAAMACHDVFAQGLIRLLSRRMDDLLAGMELCEQRNSAQRVAHYLVKHARHERDSVEVRLSSAKQVIASQLNMTPESFSRVLGRLARDGFIVPRGRHAIALTDLSGLKSLAA